MRKISRETDIIHTIEDLSGEYPPETVFSDWVKCMALAYQSSTSLFHGEIWKKREEDYLQTIKKYPKKTQEKFPELHAFLVMMMEEEVTDVLGRVYMGLNCSSQKLGQFFTPFHLSELAADIAFGKKELVEKVEVNEPSCGSGGMIIALAKRMEENGINFQKALKVTAQDLDRRSVYMTYVQMCVLGIDAVVICTDTLKTEKPRKENIFFTPKRVGMLL